MESTSAILLTLSMIHAYVFAFVLLMKRQTAKIYLALYMFNIALEYFLLLNNKLFQIDAINYLFFSLTPFISLTSLPVIYLYVKHLTLDSFYFQKKTILHFVPSLVVLVLSIFFFAIIPENIRKELMSGIQVGLEKTLPLSIIYGFSILILIGQVIGYSIHMLILLYRHDRNLENVYSSKDELSLKWLKVFVILFVFYNLYEVFVLIMNGLPTNETVYYSIISLHVFIIGIFGLRQRDIYVKNQQKESIDNDEESITRPQKIIDKKQLILNEEVIRETLIKLNNLMQVEKRYRNEDLSLYDLATELEINRNYLSHILNENLQTNFYNFVNTFRIEEAKEMLLDEKYDYLSIEGIAKNVGFKSRNVFYPVFKKLEGLTPSEYKLQHRKNS